MVSPGPLSPVLSASSAVKTHNLQLPGPVASLLENEETQKNMLWYPDAFEPAGERDNPIDYSSDHLFSPGIGAMSKNYL